MYTTIKDKFGAALDEIKSMKIYEKLCALILILQIAFIAYMNLFKIPSTLDNDAAKLFLHTIEIWKTKKLFLPNWSNMTTLEIDCSALFAMPIYGLTKNLYLSFTISNLIFIAIYIYVFYVILKRMSISRLTRLTTYTFLLIPFSFGQLLYFNMMFFSGGQYVVKVLVPIMYILVLTADEIKTSEIVIGIISAIFTLIMGVSSGPYILATGVLPVAIAYFFYDMIKTKHIKDVLCLKTAYLALVGFLSVLGEYICIRKQVNTLGNEMLLASGDGIVPNFLNKIRAFFGLFGGYAYDPVSIMSIEGLMIAFKQIVALALLIAIVAAVVDGIRNSKNSKIKAYLCVLFCVNFIIVWFTDSLSNVRYLLVFVVPVFILVAEYIEKAVLRIEDRQSVIIISAIAVFMILIELVISDYQVITDKAMPDNAHENSKFVGIVEFLREQPEKHVFVINDNGQPELYRIFDFNGEKEYLVFLTDTHTIEVHDYYWSDEYYDWLNDGFLLVGCDTNTSIDMMPESIINRSEKIGSVQNYSIYRVSP